MSRPQRFAQYIQEVAYQSLIEHEERDERPDDAPSAPEPTPRFSSWNAILLPYAPFRGPTNG